MQRPLLLVDQEADAEITCAIAMKPTLEFKEADLNFRDHLMRSTIEGLFVLWPRMLRSFAWTRKN